MSDSDLTQISLGRFRVGITGLQQAIDAVKSLQGQPEAKIAEALLNKLKSTNYIPQRAREEYKHAFLREYKRALGEQVTEDHGGLVVKILGPGCPSCDRLEQTVMAVLAELDLPAEIEHVKDLKEIHALGVFGTPALMINNVIKAMRLVPSRDRLQTWLQEAAASMSADQRNPHV
jgi:small redox-active disulfide protein 2